MLSVFPELLNYSLLAPLILRLVVGLIFLDLGFLKFGSEKARWIASFKTLGLHPADLLLSFYALIQIVGGLFLITGFLTQVATLVFVVFTGLELTVEWKVREILKRDLVFYLLIFTISLSLALTGPGAYAIDLPL
ncbi:MAG TPA: DoxX family protein [Candidatus Paceibacterota bacterium]